MGRFLIQHRMEAEELCKLVNAYNDDDKQDLLVPTEMDKQYIMKIAKVQDGFPTATHWVAGSDRYTDLDRLADEIMDTTEFASLEAVSMKLHRFVSGRTVPCEPDIDLISSRLFDSLNCNGCVT